MKNRLDPELESIIKQEIVYFTLVHKGLKFIDLISRIAIEYPTLDDSEIIKMIHELVQTNQLLRIEYIIPNQPSSIYAFYLPGSSKIL